MTTYTEPFRPYEVLLSEQPGTLSRETVTVVSGAGVLNPGTVLGKVTASGKYAPYDNTANTGIEVAACVLLQGVDATSADVAAVACERLAEVKDAQLKWHANNDAAAKTAGKADLAAKFIIAR